MSWTILLLPIVVAYVIVAITSCEALRGSKAPWRINKKRVQKDDYLKPW